MNLHQKNWDCKGNVIKQNDFLNILTPRLLCLNYECIEILIFEIFERFKKRYL